MPAAARHLPRFRLSRSLEAILVAPAGAVQRVFERLGTVDAPAQAPGGGWPLRWAWGRAEQDAEGTPASSSAAAAPDSRAGRSRAQSERGARSRSGAEPAADGGARSGAAPDGDASRVQPGAPVIRDFVEESAAAWDSMPEPLQARPADAEAWVPASEPPSVARSAAVVTAAEEAVFEQLLAMDHTADVWPEGLEVGAPGESRARGPRDGIQLTEDVDLLAHVRGEQPVSTTDRVWLSDSGVRPSSAAPPAPAAPLRGVWQTLRSVVLGSDGQLVPVDATALTLPEARAEIATLALPALDPRDAAAPPPPYLNVVVCGSFMLSYVHGNRWRESVAVLGRARALGVAPNAHMVNMAMFAVAKAGQHNVVRGLLELVPRGAQRTISFEILMLACGRRGLYKHAEATLREMAAEGIPVRDYAVVSLIAAYAEVGQWRAALAVEQRLKPLGCRRTVHVLNALLGVCVQHRQYDSGLKLLKRFRVEGAMQRSPATVRLVQTLCSSEVSAIEGQQAAAALITAAATAIGGALIRSGVF